MTEITYRGATIKLGADEYFLDIVHTDYTIVRIHQYGNNIPFAGDTLELRAKTHVDFILDGAEQSNQETILLREVKETVDIHEDIINDAILRGVL